MKLSILIPSLLRRRDLFTRLMYVLHPQFTHDVELLVDVDDGVLSVGFKRQRLLEQACGDYVVFIDDDDLVTDDYVSEILKAIEQGPDAVGFKGEVKSLVSGNTKIFEMSKNHEKWGHSADMCTYYRCIQHLNPVRRDIALQIGFADKNVGEDKEYSDGIARLIETEVCIDKVLYIYLTRT